MYKYTPSFLASIILLAASALSLPSPHAPPSTADATVKPRATRYPPSNYSGRLLGRDKDGKFIGFVPKEPTDKGIFSSTWTSVCSARRGTCMYTKDRG
jgi:hypothetical protein